MEYFEYPAGLKMTNKKFNKLFGYPVRKKDTEITQFYMDIPHQSSKSLRK